MAEKNATLTVEGVASWGAGGKTYEAGTHEVNGHDKKLLAAVEAAQAAGGQITLEGDVGDFPGQVEDDSVSLGKLQEAQESGAHAAAVAQMYAPTEDEEE